MRFDEEVITYPNCIWLSTIAADLYDLFMKKNLHTYRSQKVLVQYSFYQRSATYSIRKHLNGDSFVTVGAYLLDSWSVAQILNIVILLSNGVIEDVVLVAIQVFTEL